MPSRQPPLPSPSPPPAARHHQRRPHLAAAGAGAGAAAALVVVAVVLVVMLWWRRRKRAWATGKETEGAGVLRRVSYRQLRRATGGFVAGNKLGQGGFGPVFRGVLSVKGGGGGGKDGRPVAVKVMHAAGSLQGEREFHNEIAVASHLLASAAEPGEEARDSILLPFAYSMSARGEARARRMMLVYDLMPNGSLQDALLGRRRPELVQEWPRRLAVARDVAAALHYLHSVVKPPVVHGDVKPSNVLLDMDLRARLADFGLARVNSDLDPDGKPESGVIAEGDVIAEGGDVNGNPDGGCDDDVSVVAESTVTTTVNGEANIAPKSPEDDEGFTSASPAEAASTSGFDRTSVDSGVNSRSCNGGSRTGGATASGTGSDWWWRQDNGAASNGVKDYVMEWIRSEIKKERPKSDWIAGAAVTNPVSERKKTKRRAREWWREDYVDELTKKQKRRSLAKSKSEQTGLQWWERDIDDDLDEKARSKWNMVKSWSRRSSNSNSNGNGSINWWVNGARSSRDWASGEFVPKSGGTVSSTPSMRGTVCYVAPEYGGGGPLSEKCDIYSYGVLLLVLISGRRPLQVTASPMSEFEKASLISWARHLARASRLLDLVDPALRDVNHDEALLCITVALLCIQRSPTRRPSSEEVIRMLSCEGELPKLPLEFSPSPPGGFPFKSRKKVR
ncbi:receptor-like serine/threonine-protein kinase At2g45590 [Phragmites australis]|uniref:receptor-like serine/threonine-protein kinase At2g45590 n=1 Tax=Phragmites australis TaxID=29695 RepID=UPI002D765DFC|nr:receptor-like serine/threonine-protein kinase At2g45590 [Phragmites australis]